MEHIRYSAATCQTDLANPLDRSQMRANTDRMLGMIDSAVAGSTPFLPVRLVVFPEFAHAAPVYQTVDELRRKLAVPIPNEHTARLMDKAREHGIYVQSGSMLEEDPTYPGLVFNTTCLIGPGGILFKYRKVNTWIPYEVHASPHDIPDYDEPLFPVADTPIGRIGCAICYDWLFPEVLRQLTANGAEVLVRVSAYMDPWGATEPMAWWTLVNRARALWRTSPMSSPRTKARACATIRRTRGPADHRWSTSMDACSRRHRPDRGSGSSSRQSTSRRCGTSARRGSVITCRRICVRRPMRSTGGPATPRANVTRSRCRMTRTAAASKPPSGPLWTSVGTIRRQW